MHTKNNTRTPRANRATTKEGRAIRKAVARGLQGPALMFAQALDFDAVAAWVNGGKKGGRA